MPSVPSPADLAIIEAFVTSFTPHKRVRVCGGLARELAQAIQVAACPAMVVADRRGRDRTTAFDVDVVAGEISARSLDKITRDSRAPMIILAGAATAHRHVVSSRGAHVEEYVLDGDRIRPRGSDAQNVVAVVSSTAPLSRRLHLASGPHTLAGWVNIDNRPYPGVDRILDLRGGLPFNDAEFIFAEHFIEHLEFTDAGLLLAECRRALAPDGVLRLSTPNLDWVHVVGYRPAYWTNDGDAIRDCLVMNRAFRGWGHRFLYNWQMLEAALKQAGFANVRACTWGESSIEALKGVEGHEQYPDAPTLPHVLVAEAWGIAPPPSDEVLSNAVAEYVRDVGVS